MSILQFLHNPIALAAMAVIAIGVVIYEMTSNHNERNAQTRSGSRNPRSSEYPPASPPSPPASRPRCRKPPGNREGKGSDGSSKDRIGSIETTLRNRKHSNQTEAKSGTKSTMKQIDNKSLVDTDEKPSKCNHSEPQLPTSLGNENAECDIKNDKFQSSEFGEENYDRNIFDKLKKDVGNDNEKMENFLKNIDEEDSDSSENNIPINSKEVKLVNTNSSDSNLEGSQYMAQNIQDSTSLGVVNKRKSSLTLQHDSEEEVYKKKVCDAIKENVENENCSDISGNKFLEVNQHESIVKDQETNMINFDAEQHDTEGVCKACEEQFPNAVTYPCKHCCLCSDCAVRIYRIYKKCLVCESRIEKFETKDK